MKIALVSPPFPSSLAMGLQLLESDVEDARKKGVDIVCFPESFLPGYPGMGYSSEDQTKQALQGALDKVQALAKKHKIAIVLPMDGYIEDQLVNLAYVIDMEGSVLGFQTKNQLDPSEDGYWVAGTERQVFEVAGLKFGIVICHEGFRYPESVRWCACHGAALVFHPHCNGHDRKDGKTLRVFGAKENPYYEKAMMMRALENGIYFASVNYSSTYQESASAVFSPDGTCISHQPYGDSSIMVVEIDPAMASGVYAKRFKPDLYKY